MANGLRAPGWHAWFWPWHGALPLPLAESIAYELHKSETRNRLPLTHSLRSRPRIKSGAGSLPAGRGGVAARPNVTRTEPENLTNHPRARVLWRTRDRPGAKNSNHKGRKHLWIADRLFDCPEPCWVQPPRA